VRVFRGGRGCYLLLFSRTHAVSWAVGWAGLLGYVGGGGVFTVLPVGRLDALGFRFLGVMVRFHLETEAETDDRCSRMQKPKSNRRTKKTDISVWFRFSSVRFSVFG
jgi:hypothetical protein